jgi:hypothetical protein
MYSTRIIITLLLTSVVLLGSVVSLLLFNVAHEESVRETTREETFVDVTPALPEPATIDANVDVSQEPLSTERALGNDHGMEFPTLEE